MDAYYFTARAYAELQKNLPDARFANADLMVNWVRLIKSDAEIALMRQAGPDCQPGDDHGHRSS
jgi:ectoine hydrolase